MINNYILINLYLIIFPYHTQHTVQQTGNVILFFDRMKDFYHGSQFYLQTNEEQSNLGKPEVVVLMIAYGFWVVVWSSLTYNNDTIIFCLKKDFEALVSKLANTNLSASYRAVSTIHLFPLKILCSIQCNDLPCMLFLIFFLHFVIL